MQIGNQQYPFLDLSKYHFTDKDDGGAIQYFGYTDANGAWVIMQLNGESTCRYATGPKGYPESWANRANLAFDYLFNCTLY
jgi:hypothetical protein